MLVRGFPVDELDAGRDRARVRRARACTSARRSARTPTGRLLGHVRDRGQPRTGPEVRLYATTRAPGLPHRRRRHHRPAVPATREARAARAASRARPPSTTRSCARRRTCSTCCTSRCTGTATTSSRPARTPFFRAAGPPRRRRRARASSTSAGTSATRNGTPAGAAPHRRPARRDGADRDDRQRSRVLRRDGLPARRHPAAQQRGHPALARGLRRLRRARAQAAPRCGCG